MTVSQVMKVEEQEQKKNILRAKCKQTKNVFYTRILVCDASIKENMNLEHGFAFVPRDLFD